jgi:hypothetical protein
VRDPATKRPKYQSISYTLREPEPSVEAYDRSVPFSNIAAQFAAIRHKQATAKRPPTRAFRRSNPLELKIFLSVLRSRFSVYYTPQKKYLKFFELIFKNISLNKIEAQNFIIGEGKYYEGNYSKNRFRGYRIFDNNFIRRGGTSG